MRVLARSGEHAFLLVSEGHACVLSIEAEPLLSAPASVDTLLSRGYWEEFSGDDGSILALASHIAEEGEELPTAGWGQPQPARRLVGIRVTPHEVSGISFSAHGTLPVVMGGGAILADAQLDAPHGELREPETAGAR